MTQLERFWAKVDKTTDPNGCWVWTGATSTPGWHGVMLFGEKKQMAHRISWQIHVGPIPEGMLICHACDNPPCVRPDHLWMGTYKANMIDAARKGRLWMQRVRRTHCKQGHEFTPANTMWPHGRRRCRTCHNLARRKGVRRVDPVLRGAG